MGSLSLSSHRGLVLWQGLLVVVSMLTVWFLPTNAQFTIVSTNVAEGKDVRLKLRNRPENPIGYRWFKGEGAKTHNLIVGHFPEESYTERGMFPENRMILELDGNLVIKSAALNDSGMYTVVAHFRNSVKEIKEIGFRRLDVYEPVRGLPLLLASNSTVSVNDTVVMTCVLHALSTEWLFNRKDLQLSKRMKLSKDHRTLTIDPVHMEDAGIYQCKVYDPFHSAPSLPIFLYVHPE